MVFKIPKKFCNSYTFKQSKVLTDRPKYLRLAVFELIKLLMYQTCYDKLQPYFEQKIKQLHSMVFDSFVISLNTKDIIKAF